jgi:hypothetical protein
MRRLLTVTAVTIAIAISFASQANALTVRDVIELSRAGVSDQVLLALIDVDHRVYTLDAGAVKEMKNAGVSDAVLLAMIHAGREPASAAPLASADTQPSIPGVQTPVSPAPQPQVVVIDHSDMQPAVREVPVPVAVAVPVVIPYTPFDLRTERVSTIITTDTGAAVRARVPVPPNCTKVEPIYWGNGGKRRAGTWAPPTQVVCR